MRRAASVEYSVYSVALNAQPMTLRSVRPRTMDRYRKPPAVRRYVISDPIPPRPFRVKKAEWRLSQRLVTRVLSLRLGHMYLSDAFNRFSRITFPVCLYEPVRYYRGSSCAKMTAAFFRIPFASHSASIMEGKQANSASLDRP
jgi:hypothetical protein